MAPSCTEKKTANGHMTKYTWEPSFLASHIYQLCIILGCLVCCKAVTIGFVTPAVIIHVMITW